MYIQKIHIQNIRSIADFTWELPAEDKLAGWHVLIGDNGSGKSTVLQSMSLGLMGVEQSLALNLRWHEWLRVGRDAGHIDLSFAPSATLGDSLVNIKDDLVNSINLERWGRDSQYVHLRLEVGKIHSINEGFSAAYGPFRRFSGDDFQHKLLMEKQDLVSAHASMFHDGIALSNYRKWLGDLARRGSHGYVRPEDEQEVETARKLERNITRFINQKGFLPYNTRFNGIGVGNDSIVKVFFIDGDGNHIYLEQLGNSFRSILSMTFDLIRQMIIQYDDVDMVFDDADPTIIKAPGVVLIDEVDAHLHPEWQRRIGFWLTAHFPNIQFIVTTHSPLVCQAASTGSIWRLPAPGSGEMGQQVSRDSEDWKRLVYGDILEAYSTDLFGENINRSPEAQEKMERVAALSGKELDAPLTLEETEELAHLMDELPSTPYKRI